MLIEVMTAKQADLAPPLAEATFERFFHEDERHERRFGGLVCHIGADLSRVWLG
jgi:hypothetical protein